jgi:hypothetical protein
MNPSSPLLKTTSRKNTSKKKQAMPFKTPATLLRKGIETRFSAVLNVLDEALHSEMMKERIWAVEQLLKLFFQDKKGNVFSGIEEHSNIQTMLDPSGLSDAELTHLIEQQLRSDVA